MDNKTYIESGILELFIAGLLSEKENLEIYEAMMDNPDILHEVLEIENAIVKLTASVSPSSRNNSFELILNKIKGMDTDPSRSETKVVTLTETEVKYNWLTYAGWAAAILLGAALFWTLNTKNELETTVAEQEIENALLETQIADAKNDVEANKQLLARLRNRDIIPVPLAGQGDFESTYAKVYWNKQEDLVLLDAQGLPDPPSGKVYQVWSLKMSPLTPTSLGTLDTFIDDENKIFSIENALESEAFGITLEPAGGSETPTMEQLYTLGVVEVKAAP